MSKKDEPSPTTSSEPLKSAKLGNASLDAPGGPTSTDPRKRPYDKFQRQRRVEDWFPN